MVAHKGCNVTCYWCRTGFSRRRPPEGGQRSRSGGEQAGGRDAADGRLVKQQDRPAGSRRTDGNSGSVVGTLVLSGRMCFHQLPSTENISLNLILIHLAVFCATALHSVLFSHVVEAQTGRSKWQRDIWTSGLLYRKHKKLHVATCRGAFKQIYFY